MLSGRLVHLIESHWEEIIASVISQIRREPEGAHYRASIESELREWGRLVLQNLGEWLTGHNQDEISQQYEQLGKLRFQENVPLFHSVHVLAVVRERVL